MFRKGAAAISIEACSLVEFGGPQPAKEGASGINSEALAVCLDALPGQGHYLQEVNPTVSGLSSARLLGRREPGMSVHAVFVRGHL